MSTTTLPDLTLVLQGDHRHSSTTAPTPLSLPSAVSQTEYIPSSHLSHLDRDSAIALGILLLLILLAIAYYTHVHIKHKTQADPEQAAEQNQTDRREQSLRMGSTWSKSTGTIRASQSTAGTKKETRKELRVDSGASTIVGSVEEAHIPSPPHSPYPRRFSASSNRSCHRRQSSVNIIPSSFIGEPRRLSSSDGMRRGSRARLDRRISSLETIHERDGAGVKLCRQGVMGQGASYDWTRPECAVLDTNTLDAVPDKSAQGRGTPRCIVPGVVPECVSDEEEEEEEPEADDDVVLGDFRGVVWDKESKCDEGRSAFVRDIGPAPDEREIESVQRVDCAQVDAANGPRRHMLF